MRQVLRGAAEGLSDFSFVVNNPGSCTEPMDAWVAWPELVYIRVYQDDAWQQQRRVPAGSLSLISPAPVLSGRLRVAAELRAR